MQTIRALVHQLVPDAMECVLWGMPTFRLSGGGNIIQIAAFARKPRKAVRLLR
ncbi:hypothetical protein [Sphaerochaeta sp. UBA5856]|uniref:hypothetical protein n=1 Tax=Sphaerochaeta sp. UBA5856 TaxID=1947476 RepID=UPI0039C90600